MRVDADVDRLREHVLGTHGRIDVLVNNVGHYLRVRPFDQSEPEMWQQLYEINLLHVFRVTHAFLPSMLEQQRGAIVNVSSVEGARGYPPDPVYGAFKAAVIHFTKCLAVDVAGRGVRVNGIGPDLTQSQQVDYETLDTGGRDLWPIWAPRRAPGRARGPGAGDPVPGQQPVGVHRGPDAAHRRRQRRRRRLVPHRAPRRPSLDQPPDRPLIARTSNKCRSRCPYDTGATLLGARSLPGRAVEQLAGGVGVAGVARGLVDQVEQHPPEVGVVAPSHGSASDGSDRTTASVAAARAR